MHARLVVQNALFSVRGRAGRLVVPWCTYTSPELAHVGLTMEAAAAAGSEVDMVRVSDGVVDYDAFRNAPEFQRYLEKLAAFDP